MMVKKTFLVSVFVLFGYLFSTHAEEETTAGDKELMSKLFTIVLKCFKDADWSACGEMITGKYDITQPKYKQCTCSMACTGEELGMMVDGVPVHDKYLEYVKSINHPGVKKELQTIYDKCSSVKGIDKCELSEKFAECSFRESSVLKERATALLETFKKMKGN